MAKAEQILAALKDLKQNGPKTARHGICANISEQYNPEFGINSLSAMEAVWFVAPMWPEYSGNSLFPVEGSELQYNRHVNKWEGMHGPARKRLLDFLIKYFEGQVNE